MRRASSFPDTGAKEPWRSGGFPRLGASVDDMHNSRGDKDLMKSMEVSVPLPVARTFIHFRQAGGLEDMLAAVAAAGAARIFRERFGDVARASA